VVQLESCSFPAALAALIGVGATSGVALPDGAAHRSGNVAPRRRGICWCAFDWRRSRRLLRARAIGGSVLSRAEGFDERLQRTTLDFDQVATR
jgi:hypothetical protein